MRNAVEHGNLGIGYDEKASLLRSGSWREEVERRLNLSENHGKFASLTFETTEEAVVIRIKDEGEGFDWQRYLDFSPERAAAPMAGVSRPAARAPSRALNILAAEMKRGAPLHCARISAARVRLDVDAYLVEVLTVAAS